MTPAFLFFLPLFTKCVEKGEFSEVHSLRTRLLREPTAREYTARSTKVTYGEEALTPAPIDGRLQGRAESVAQPAIS